jgi:hypothetical protein
MYIYYNNEIINTDSVFNITISVMSNESNIRFRGPSEGRYTDIPFKDENTAIQVIKGIYSGLDSGWSALDIQKDILDKISNEYNKLK